LNGCTRTHQPQPDSRRNERQQMQKEHHVLLGWAAGALIALAPALPVWRALQAGSPHSLLPLLGQH
jgi:hypothetical protein